uniref:Uncharacterized protein n=1 Tax=Arundo donax TaxID=35708 RepID=A0A0A9BME8_ARUDO
MTCPRSLYKITNNISFNFHSSS